MAFRIIPAVGGTQLIGRYLPQGQALFLLATGVTIDAQQAHAWGLVQALCEGEPLAAALEAARAIAANSPFAVAMAKRAFKLGQALPLELGVEVALESYYRTVAHPDRQEGVQAFNQRRPPVYDESE